MHEFSIYGEADFITITLDEVYDFPESTSYLGGYSTRTSLKIKSGDFKVATVLWTSTGMLYELLQKLKECNAQLSGGVSFFSHEHNFELFLTYDVAGHINVAGKFSSQSELKNELHFEFMSDQSFIASTIKQLESLAEKYGDQKGIRK